MVVWVIIVVLGGLSCRILLFFFVILCYIWHAKLVLTLRDSFVNIIAKHGATLP